MRILITGAASRLGRAVADELRDGNQLRLLDSEAVATDRGTESVVADLGDADAVWSAVRDVDAVVHTGELPAQLPEETEAREAFLLDWYTRGTHVLFKAAVEAGVRRFVYGSTLDVFRPYADDVYISEMWRPLPTPDTIPMSRYLGELTCREFARDFLVTVTALRLGTLVIAEEMASATDPDLLWLDVGDAAQAFRLALTRDASDRALWTQRWGLVHVCAAIANPKYLIDRAVAMGFDPAHDFRAQWEAAR